MQRRFTQVDVFTSVAYCGNPLAVVIDGEGLSDEAMARFANWTNLSETTFIVATTDARADYRVRIFTASGELPFAGHPTLGTCHAWLCSGGVPRQRDEVLQECGVGIIRVRRSDDRLAFAAPPLLKAGPVDEATMQVLLTQLNATPSDIVAAEWVDNGPGWIGVLLRSADAVLALRPAATGWLKIGVTGAYPNGAPHEFEVRGLFSSASGVMAEDPVTGSLNASLAQWLLASGRATSPYIASQGTVLGRAGRVHVERIGSDIWIGGDTISCIVGTVELT